VTLKRKHIYVAIAIVVVLLPITFLAGRITAPRDIATVTAAARADASSCRGGTGTNEIYLVRWTVKNVEAGICVKPDSACARTAYVGGVVPKTCRDQGE